MNYTGLASTAAKLIKSNGKTATLRKVGTEVFVPETGKMTSAAYTDYSVSVVETDFTMSVRKEPLIKSDVRKFLLSTVNVLSILNTDLLIVDSIALAIVDAIKIIPGSIVIYYEVVCNG